MIDHIPDNPAVYIMTPFPYPFSINMDPVPSTLKMEIAGSVEMSELTYNYRRCLSSHECSLDSRVT